MERNNFTETNRVLMEQDSERNTSTQPQPLSFYEWPAPLEAGKKNELLERVDEFIDRMQQRDVGLETVEAFYYGVLHHVYQAINHKCLSVHDVFSTHDVRNIATATKLLINSNVKVSSIAEKVGYCHFSFFSKNFKEYNGMSP
jgi:two-component system response regulator YesN